MNDPHHPELVGPEPAAGGSGRSLSHHRVSPIDTGLSYYTGGYGAEELAAPALPPKRNFTPRDLLIQAFYNKKLIRNCMAAGVLLGLFAAVLSHTQYTADSLLVLFTGGQPALSSDMAGGGSQIDSLKAVQSEVSIIQSDDVLRHTVERAGADNLFPGLGRRRLFGLLPAADAMHQEASAVTLLRKNLKVDAETGTNVIRVAYTAPDRERSVQVVKALVDAYLDRRKQLYSTAESSYYGQEIGQYDAQLKQIDAKIQAVRNKYSVLDITQDIALASNRLDGVVQRENQIRERRTTVHAETTAAKAELAGMPQQVFDSKETSNTAANDDARNTLLRLEQDREHMAAQYSPGWPALRELDQKIAAVRAQISDNSHGTFFSARSTRNPVYDQINSRLASLQLEDQSLDKQLTELEKQYQQAQQRVIELRDADSQLHDLQRSREVAENIYKQLSLRQAGSEFQNAAVDSRNASLRVAQPATAPLTGHSMALTYILAGVVLGLAIAVAASVIATLMRQVYIMPSEAERDLDLASLAEFSVAGSNFTSREGRQQVGNLAAFMLDVTVDGRPLSVVQVVAASETEGKSALVRALATELAQGHGLRTLILDLHSDGRAEAGALGGADNRHLSVLETDMPVVATDVPQLWVSVDAARSSLGNSRTLITRSRELIEGLRQRFDMVLIISPPEMSDYAARRLSSLVDANLLVIRSEHTRSPVAMQLRDTILSAGGNLLGFAYTWRRYYIPQAIYRWL